jgi:hypothetical protein
MPRGNAYGYFAKLSGEHLDAQTIQEQRLAQAGDARQTQMALADTEAILAQAEAALGGIVKHYPPYLQDSSERIDLLNQVSGLKKQIEALNFPPRSTAEAEAFAPVFEKILGLAEDQPADVSDEALAGLLQEVEAARIKVNERQTEMWSDLFVQDAPQTEQAAITQTMTGRHDIAGTHLSISRSSVLLADMA